VRVAQPDHDDHHFFGALTVHKLLERQIKRHLGDNAKLSPELLTLFTAVDEAYTSADADRLMIERSLDLMSQELTDANAGLRSQLVELQRTELALLKEKEEQRVLIRKLEDIHSQLLQSEKMASIGQLAAGIAHEINNPIGYVYSNLGTLDKYVQDGFLMLELYEQAEGTITDPGVKSRILAAKQKMDLVFLKSDLRALMDESKEGIIRVKAIVQNLKDFSHADTSEEWHYSDLHKGLESTLLIVNNEIKYKAEVVREYGDIPPVECLLSQLNQVFMNLLVNAAHAIEEHGTITVRTGREGDEVWVDIVDTGKGIPPENMKKIFDPFFTTKPVGKGTGLGLSVSYGIVQKHHGRMEVKSEIGKGSTFRVWLPVDHPQQ
jgi:signal transduction histidine kinase